MRRAALLLPLLCLAATSYGGVHYTAATPDVHIAATAATVRPGSLVSFVNADSNHNGIVWALGKSDSAAGDYYLIYVQSVPSISWVTDKTAGGQGTATTSSGPTNGTWYTLGANEAVAARDVYIDGGSKGSDATSTTPIAVDQTTIGALNRNGVDITPFDGIVAWTINYGPTPLTDAQHASLAAGRWPPYESFQQVRNFWVQGHFDGTTTQVDVVGGQVLTIGTGAPTLVPHKNTFVRPGMWQ